MKKVKALSLIVAALLFSTQVLAQEYEEIRYEDLVQKLAQKKNKITHSLSSPLDDIMIHAGFGLISSINSIQTAQTNTVKQQNGFQLSFGIDLFSPEWAAEGAIRNFGTQVLKTETMGLRELDMKVMFRKKTTDRTGFRLGAGLATRYMRYADTASQVDISETTPSSLFFAGSEAYVNRHFSFGVELGYRTALVSRSLDKSALDLMVRMDSFF